MHNVAVQTSYPLRAILWDFDGTMADTSLRNLSVNRRIVEEMTGRTWQEVSALSSVEAYHAAWNRVSNWQELYVSALGLTREQCAQAASRWAPYQLNDPTPVPLFDGVAPTLEHFKDLAQAVVSQNDRAIIAQALRAARVDRYFAVIIGYAEVPMHRQKPAPDGLLRAIDDIGVTEPATVLFVGDHEADILCAANANRDLVALGRELRVLSVAAHFGDGSDGAGWKVVPNHRIEHPAELVGIVDSLREGAG